MDNEAGTFEALVFMFAGFLVNIVLIRLLWPKVVANFEPQNPANTPRNAWITTALIVFLGGTSSLAFGERGMSCAGSVVTMLAVGLLAKFLYRLSFGLGVGMALVLTLAMNIISYGVIMVCLFLWAVHPAVVGLFILIVASIPLLSHYSKKRLQARFDAVE